MAESSLRKQGSNTTPGDPGGFIKKPFIHDHSPFAGVPGCSAVRY
jgi:hypothetical protein